MAQQTQYVVQPFQEAGRGRLKPLLPIRATGREHADRMAERLARKGGAIAACQTGDPETGDYGEPEIIASYGAVPDGVLDGVV